MYFFSPCSPPPRRMHCFGKATFLNVRYLCCHGCVLQLCRWRRANNFLRPPSGCLLIALFIPITVVIVPPMGSPRPQGSTSGCRRGSIGSSGRRSSTRSAAPQEAAAEEARALAALVAWVAGVAVAAVQVQHYVHICIKKSRGWVAVKARFNPGLGVALQTKATITSKRCLGRVERFGFSPPLPPPSRWPCCTRPFRKMAWGFRVFLGVTPQVWDWVVGQLRQPAEQIRALRGKFEEEVRKFKAAEVTVTEMCGGKRQGRAGLQEKERRLRHTASAQSKKEERPLVRMRAPWGEAKKRHLLKSPLPQMPASTVPAFGKWDVTGGGGGMSSCTASVLPCMRGGVEIFDLAGTRGGGATLRVVGRHLPLPPPPPRGLRPTVSCQTCRPQASMGA